MSSDELQPSHEHLLIGLEGTNPLAALAAFGTLRTLSGSDFPSVRMSWKLVGSQWRPTLHLEEPLTTDEIVARLDELLDVGEQPLEFSLPEDDGTPRKNLSDLAPDDFKDICRRLLHDSNRDNRRVVDFCAAYGSDAVDPDEDQIEDTALRTMSGSGHQHFLGFMRDFVELTESHHIESALFARWDYADEKPSMRWDPHDDRRHAYMAINPSNQVKGNEIRTMRGANRLAIEALPLFPTFPTERGVKTCSFYETGREIFLTWPVWESPLELPTVSSLLGHPQLVSDTPNRAELRRFGITELYRARRLTVRYFRNFALGRPVDVQQR